MDYKDKVVNAEVILPDGYSIGGSGLPSQSFKLYTEDTATIKLSGNGEKATPLKGVVVVAEDENNALQAGDNGLAVKVSPAANNLLELKQGALYVTAPEINIPISPKEGNALTNLTSEGEEGLYVAPTKVQGWIYDPAPGVAAIPGMFGFGSDLVGIDTVYFNNKAEFLTWVQNTRSGRYLVSQIYGSEPIINSNVTFSGILEVIPTSGVGDEQYLPNVWKDLIFYGVNYGDIWYTRFITQPNRLDSWRCLDKTTDIINLQNSKAPLYNPNFSGTPTAPTPSDSASGTQIANVDFVKKQVSNNTYTLSAGTVTVLDSGSQPTIEITGQSPSQVLNLGIPKAPDGQTIKSVNAVVKEIDSAQQVTLTFTMTDDTNQQASFNIPFSPQPTMKLSATSGNFSFNYSDTPSAKNAAGRSGYSDTPSAKNVSRPGSSIYLKTTVDLNRAPAGSTDVMVDVRLTEIPCTEDGTYLDYDIYAEYPSVVGSGQPTVAVWLILPTVPTHTIDPKTKTITKLLRGDGLSGLNGIIPIAGADEQVHEFKYFLQYSYLNN